MSSHPSDPAVNFLNSARDYDITSLARNTRKTLDIILPWCQSQQTSSVSALTKQVHRQAVEYACAIDLSVVAAHFGFSVAEDAVFLIGLMQTTETTAEERHEFLQGTMELARKGRKHALEAKNKFIDVRNVVEGCAKRLMEDHKAKESLYYEELVHGKLVAVSKPLNDAASQLIHGIQHLEELRDSLTQFCDWWNIIEMETRTQIDRERQLLDSPTDRLRMKAVCIRWDDHRRRYASYVNEISLVQDFYPDLFVESKKVQDIGVQSGNSPPHSPVTRMIFETQPPTYSPITNDPMSFTVNDIKGAPHDNGVHSKHSGISQAPPRPHHTRGQSNVIISERFDSLSSYLDARLQHVHILEPNRAFLMLNLQCHTDNAHRCCSIKIKWKFSAAEKSSNTPQIIDIAPRQSVGAHTEEGHKRNLGVNAPVQMNMAGATIGPELTGNWERTRVVSRAMMFTGSIRGYGSDSAEWSVVENTGAKAGIPSHFCVGVVVDYNGPLKMELTLDSKHVSATKLWKSHAKAKNEYRIDVDAEASKFEPYRTSGSWKDWFYSINGETDGTAHIYNQPALRRA